MITCTRCGTKMEKRHKLRSLRCKACLTAIAIAWQKRNPEKYKAIKARQRGTECLRLKRRRQDPVERVKTRARNAVFHAIKTGKIQRQPCEVCGAPKVDAHHDDYSKRFDVRWLCRPHHNAFHNGEIL